MTVREQIIKTVANTAATLGYAGDTVALPAAASGTYTAPAASGAGSIEGVYFPRNQWPTLRPIKIIDGETTAR